MQKDYLPREMIISYRDKDDTRLITLDYDTLHMGDEKYTPVRGEWEEFWEKLDQIGIWDWEENYEKCTMVEDYHWEVTILTNSINIYSQGCNDGPVHMVKGEFKSSLDEFWDALEDLCGWRIDY
ncbi:MAG: hypothetical protein CIT03_07520 [Methanobacterium sp.]|nr:MAG: hypothetical protein CIT03_07520 [Methanobacterium sp.]